MQSVIRPAVIVTLVLALVLAWGGVRAETLRIADRLEAAQKGSGFAMEGFFVCCDASRAAVVSA